jgi:hypothetical protein
VAGTQNSDVKWISFIVTPFSVSIAELMVAMGNEHTIKQLYPKGKSSAIVFRNPSSPGPLPDLVVSCHAKASTPHDQASAGNQGNSPEKIR